MLDPRAFAALGIGHGADLLARIGLWPGARRRRGAGMSYEEVLSATLGFREAQKILAEQRKKKRRGRRAREREHMLLMSGGWPA